MVRASSAARVWVLAGRGSLWKMEKAVCKTRRLVGENQKAGWVELQIRPESAIPGALERWIVDNSRFENDLALPQSERGGKQVYGQDTRAGLVGSV